MRSPEPSQSIAPEALNPDTQAIDATCQQPLEPRLSEPRRIAFQGGFDGPSIEGSLDSAQDASDSERIP